MSDGPVAFLDSGLGGVPYLLATRAAAPHDSYVYFADNAYFPYGERSIGDVRERVTTAVERLIELASPRLVVVACNTASVVALATLRARFELPFVGVVPAIKPAAERVGSGRIGVLATARTVGDQYVAGLIRTYAPGNEVVLVAAGGLVELIERRLGSFTTEDLERALTHPLQNLRAVGVDAVVLGCTHFIHVRTHIEGMLGHGAEVIDSVEGVVRQTLRLAGPGRRDPESGSRTRFFLSDLDSAPGSYRHLERSHGFLLCNAHECDRAHR